MQRSARPLIPGLCIAGLLAGAPVASQAEQSDWIFRVGGHVLNPKSENLRPVLAGTPDVSTLVLDLGGALSGDVTYLFSPHFGIELFLSTPFRNGIDLKPYAGGTTRIGETELMTPTLSLVWQFMPESPLIRPYIGVGANWTTFSSGDLRGGPLGNFGLPGNTKLEFDDTFGPAGVAGVDIPFKRNWFVNLNARWIDMGSDAELQVPGSGREKVGTVDIDPWLFGVMVGYRFAGAAPLPEPAPVAVVAPPPPPPPARCADGDMDGVCDVDDKCPNTPAGTTVDRVGCPLSQTLKVLFDFDSAELRPESITELERVVRFMGDVPFATTLVEGHTDSIGTEAYNLELSDRRAKAVFDYLSSRGVDPSRIKSAGLGESQPIADNATAEGRQLNRRVMLIRTDTGR